ncbi:MAG TPA: hypothetical protein VLV81_07750 [Acidimicrobiia bacterium]|nr:hypothetical protein [Acidimicrobiia bacterium]
MQRLNREVAILLWFLGALVGVLAWAVVPGSGVPCFYTSTIHATPANPLNGATEVPCPSSVR